MIKQSLPAVSLVTVENFDTFAKSDKVVIVGFFEADDTTSNQTFTAVANVQRDDFIFGATNDASLAESQGVKLPGVVLYKTYDEGKDIYAGEFELESLKAWTKQSAVPLMGEVGPETYTGYMESGLPLAYIFVDSEADKKRLGEELTPVAAKFQGRVNFATIDAIQFGGHAGNLNLYCPFATALIGVVRRNGRHSQSKMSRRTRNSLSINLKRLLPRLLRNLSIVMSTEISNPVSRVNLSPKHRKDLSPLSSPTRTMRLSLMTAKMFSLSSTLLG